MQNAILTIDIYDYIILLNLILHYGGLRRDMKYLLFVNRKGGVGKSLCCAETVLSLRRSGIETDFVDLDAQNGNILKPSESPNSKVACIDTPGTLTSDLAEWIQNADVVICPTLAATVEQDSVELMIKAFKANRKRRAKMIIVLNRFTRWTNCQDFIEWLHEVTEGITGVEITTLAQSELFAKAGGHGESVITYYPKSSAAASALNMVNTIRRAAGLPEE